VGGGISLRAQDLVLGGFVFSRGIAIHVWPGSPNVDKNGLSCKRGKLSMVWIVGTQL